MIRHYGSNDGFGWQRNEIVGAQIVSVPMALPVRMANEAFQTLLIYVAGVFLASRLFWTWFCCSRSCGAAKTLDDGGPNQRGPDGTCPSCPWKGKTRSRCWWDRSTACGAAWSRALKMLEG